MTRSPSSLLDDPILVLRGLRVLLDADLAALYGVSTKAFNQAVKRNAKRFSLTPFLSSGGSRDNCPSNP
jgi:hypothetical protein